MAQDGKKDVVKIMGNATGQGTDTFHFPGLPVLQFKPSLFGDIPGYGKKTIFIFNPKHPC